jgi:hypothetical protein
MDEGRWNKKLLNAKRSLSACDQETSQDQHAAATSERTPASPQDAPCTDTTATHDEVTQARPDPAYLTTQVDLGETFHVDVKVALDGFTLDQATLLNSPLLPYLAMVARVIERRAIRADELLRLLLRSMRQRSFDSLPRREYVLCFLKQHPP